MRRERNERGTTRRALVWGLLPLALTAVGCASQRPTPLVLAPLAESATTTAVESSTADTSLPRRPTTTVRRTTPRPTAPAGSAVGAPAAAPPTTVVVARAAGATGGGSGVAASTGRVGNPRPAVTAPSVPEVPGAPGGPATPPTVPAPRVAGPTPVSPPPGFPSPASPVPVPVTTLPVTAPLAPLQLTAPAGRSVPDGPFDVVVTGSGSYVLGAQPASVCTVDGGRVHPVGAGECRVRAAAPGFAETETVVPLRRGDQTISWQFGATVPFTYNTLALDLRATSGLPVRATAATGTCKLAGPNAVSFSVVAGGGFPRLGECSVTAVVDESPAWNAATAVLSTTTTRAPVTLTFDVPSASALPAFNARVVLTQADRSLDTLLAFSIESAGPCSLGASATLADPSTRTATMRVRGAAPTNGWCVVRVHTDVAGAASLVSFTTPGCRFVWIGEGTPSATKPACPW